MRCLILYASFTGQAARAAQLAAQAAERAGWDVATRCIVMSDPADAMTRPLGLAGAKRWTQAAQAGQVVPVALQPADGLDESFDAVLLFSNTWGGHPSVPVNAFLHSDAARRLMAGRPFAVYVVCRRLWQKNLAITRALGEAAGGRFIGSAAFTHPGSQIGSLLQTVTYLIGSAPPRRSLLGVPLPAYGLSDEALARVGDFTREMLAAAATQPDIAGAA